MAADANAAVAAPRRPPRTVGRTFYAVSRPDRNDQIGFFTVHARCSRPHCIKAFSTFLRNCVRHGLAKGFARIGANHHQHRGCSRDILRPAAQLKGPVRR